MLRCDSFRVKAMNDLVNCTGEIVYVNYVESGIPSLTIGKMKHVSRFDFIMVQATKIIEDNLRIIADASISKIPFMEDDLRAIASASRSKIPFIGEGVAIQKINIRGKKRNRAIYDNFFIKDDYELTDPVRVSELKDIIFGNFESG